MPALPAVGQAVQDPPCCPQLRAGGDVPGRQAPPRGPAHVLPAIVEPAHRLDRPAQVVKCARVGPRFGRAGAPHTPGKKRRAAAYLPGTRGWARSRWLGQGPELGAQRQRWASKAARPGEGAGYRARQPASKASSQSLRPRRAPGWVRNPLLEAVEQRSEAEGAVALLGGPGGRAHPGREDALAAAVKHALTQRQQAGLVGQQESNAGVPPPRLLGRQAPRASERKLGVRSPFVRRSRTASERLTNGCTRVNERL